MSSPAEIPPDPHRKRGGCVFLVVPTVMIPLVLGGYAMMWGLGIQGRAPTGDRVEMSYTGCPEARDVVLSRVENMGLGDPKAASTETGFTITAQMPDDARVAGLIPETLTERGVFAVYYGADRADLVAQFSDVERVFPRMTTDASAVSVVELKAELGVTIQSRQMQDPEGFLELWVDDVFLERFGNNAPLVNGEIEIEPEPETHRDAIERAASRAIVLADPLPCAIELNTTAVVSP